MLGLGSVWVPAALETDLNKLQSLYFYAIWYKSDQVLFCNFSKSFSLVSEVSVQLEVHTQIGLDFDIIALLFACFQLSVFITY